MMTEQENPWEVPEWHSIKREASLARNLIGSGVTALGKANYADKLGEYYTAFFGLSIGIERLTKLILVANHTIKNNGQLPPENVVRRFGHNLSDLVAESESISNELNLRIRHSKPSSPICNEIIERLNGFADARQGRYANFSALGDPELGQEEPVQRWWGAVAEMILESHYYGTSAQARVESKSSTIDSMMSGFTMVRQTNESGEMMTNIESASVRTGQNKIVQKYGRFYTLLVVRWLSCVFGEISQIACHSHGVTAFFGSDEYLQAYTVEDSFLKTRKVWPLT